MWLPPPSPSPQVSDEFDAFRRRFYRWMVSSGLLHDRAGPASAGLPQAVEEEYRALFRGRGTAAPPAHGEHAV